MTGEHNEQGLTVFDVVWLPRKVENEKLEELFQLSSSDMIAAKFLSFDAESNTTDGLT